MSLPTCLTWKHLWSGLPLGHTLTTHASELSNVSKQRGRECQTSSRTTQPTHRCHQPDPAAGAAWTTQLKQAVCHHSIKSAAWTSASVLGESLPVFETSVWPVFKTLFLGLFPDDCPVSTGHISLCYVWSFRRKTGVVWNGKICYKLTIVRAARLWLAGKYNTKNHKWETGHFLWIVWKFRGISVNLLKVLGHFDELF